MAGILIEQKERHFEDSGFAPKKSSLFAGQAGKSSTSAADEAQSMWRDSPASIFACETRDGEVEAICGWS
jgi:hypothetical protein